MLNIMLFQFPGLLVCLLLLILSCCIHLVSASLLWQTGSTSLQQRAGHTNTTKNTIEEYFNSINSILHTYEEV